MEFPATTTVFNNETSSNNISRQDQHAYTNIKLRAHEILVLLAIRPSGSLVRDAAIGQNISVSVAMRIAILHSLTRLGKIRLDKEKQVYQVISATTTNDPILDEALSNMLHRAEHGMSKWITEFYNGKSKIVDSRRRTLEQLMKKGILNRTNVDRWKVSDQKLKQDIVDKIRYVCLTPREQLKVCTEEGNITLIEATGSSEDSVTTTLASQEEPRGEPEQPQVLDDCPSPTFSFAMEQGEEELELTDFGEHEDDDIEDDFEIITHADVEVELPIKYLSHEDYTLMLIVIPLLVMSKNSIFKRLFTVQELPSALKKALSYSNH